MIAQFSPRCATGFLRGSRYSMGLAMVGVCLLLAGCRTGAQNLSDCDLLAIELIPADRGYYRDIRLERTERELIVHGYVKRFLEPGHMRLQLLSRGGMVVAEDRVRVSRPPRSSRVRHAAFMARMTEPSEPVSLKISYEPFDSETD